METHWMQQFTLHLFFNSLTHKHTHRDTNRQLNHHQSVEVSLVLLLFTNEEQCVKLFWGLELFEPHYSVLDSDQHHGERHSIQSSALTLDLNLDSLYIQYNAKHWCVVDTLPMCHNLTFIWIEMVDSVIFLQLLHCEE